MDEAAIRAKAEKMAAEIDEMSNEYFMAKSMDYSSPIVYPVKRLGREIEAALTKVWDEEIEAAVQVPHDPCKPADILKAKETAIRRLRKGTAMATPDLV